MTGIKNDPQVTPPQATSGIPGKMDDANFDRLASATLRELMAAIEAALPDELEDIDLQGSVLTIELAGGGTYVINKHAANKEIWLSSPKSGAAHFAYAAASGEWQPTRGGPPLHARLGAELAAVAGRPVSLAPVAAESGREAQHEG